MFLFKNLKKIGSLGEKSLDVEAKKMSGTVTLFGKGKKRQLNGQNRWQKASFTSLT